MAYDKTVVVFTIKDAKNQVATKSFELVATAAAQAETDADAMYALYQPLCNGQILSYSVNGIKAVTDSPTASSLKTDVMSITAQLNGRPEKGNIRLPCFPDSKSDANGNLDLDDADVVAFRDAFIAVSTNLARISDGESISSFLSGKLRG